MKLTIPKIIDTVAEYYDITPDELMSKSRKLLIIKARHISIFFARDMLQLSYHNIAKFYQVYDGKDTHATIMHGVNSVTNQMENNKVFASEVRQIHNMLLRQFLDDSTYENNTEVFMENDFYPLPQPKKKFESPFKNLSVYDRAYGLVNLTL